MSKGSRNRITNQALFGSNYDDIFKKKEVTDNSSEKTKPKKDKPTTKGNNNDTA